MQPIAVYEAENNILITIGSFSEGEKQDVENQLKQQFPGYTFKSFEISTPDKRFVFKGATRYNNFADNYARLAAEGRLIVLPCALQTPVIKISYNEHDEEFVMSPMLFTIDMRDKVGTEIFLTANEALTEIRELTEKNDRR